MCKVHRNDIHLNIIRRQIVVDLTYPFLWLIHELHKVWLCPRILISTSMFFMVFVHILQQKIYRATFIVSILPICLVCRQENNFLLWSWIHLRNLLCNNLKRIFVANHCHTNQKSTILLFILFPCAKMIIKRCLYDGSCIVLLKWKLSRVKCCAN